LGRILLGIDIIGAKFLGIDIFGAMDLWVKVILRERLLGSVILGMGKLWGRDIWGG
jgi:hypothetical protein